MAPAKAPAPTPDPDPTLTGPGTDPAYSAPATEDRALANVREALADMAEAAPSVVREDPPEGEEPDPDPPVYDERGNVRPRGTPGARPMTKAERVAIARKLQAGETIVTTAERPVKVQAKADPRPE